MMPHVREVFEAACEANVALRQEYQGKMLRLENELRMAEEKIAVLERDAATAISSREESQKDRDAVCDTLAALQQELEVAHVTNDQVTEELRAAANMGAQYENDLQHARTVSHRSTHLVTVSKYGHHSRKLNTYRSSSPTLTEAV